MKVISLVPSWTETLVAAGVDVVGRTRFCIHPAEKIRNIPVVGGTKDLKIQVIQSLQPDFIVLDKEENTLAMSKELEQQGFKLLITHVLDISSCILGLELMSQKLNNQNLQDYADRYKRVIKNTSMMDQLKRPLEKSFQYVIWRNPWMTASRHTFIGDVMSLLGVDLPVMPQRYPTLSDETIQQAYCFFSTEPYPFEKKWSEIQKLNLRGELIDGEAISWYGLRNLNYLESLKSD